MMNQKLKTGLPDVEHWQHTYFSSISELWTRTQNAYLYIVLRYASVSKIFLNQKYFCISLVKKCYNYNINVVAYITFCSVKYLVQILTYLKPNSFKLTTSWVSSYHMRLPNQTSRLRFSGWVNSVVFFSNNSPGIDQTPLNWNWQCFTSVRNLVTSAKEGYLFKLLAILASSKLLLDNVIPTYHRKTDFKVNLHKSLQ